MRPFGRYSCLFFRDRTHLLSYRRPPYTLPCVNFLPYVCREEDGGRFREQDGDNSAWTGVPLDGVWDVVESTLSRATGDAAAQPTLDTLFEGSGACVVKGDGRNEQGGPEDLWRKEGLMGRAKL